MTHVNGGLRVAGLFRACTSAPKTTIGDNLNYSLGECLQIQHVVRACVCVCVYNMAGGDAELCITYHLAPVT